MKFFKKRSPLQESAAGSNLAQHMPGRKTNIWLGLVILLFAGLTLVAGGLLWYQKNTAPLDPNGTPAFFTVEQGDSASEIAERLRAEGFIRNALAFKVALRLSGETAQNIKTGQYRLSPAESAQQIIAKLEKGAPDLAQLTIIPGENLLDIRKKLRDIGYTEQAVDSALNKSYDHPALESKPESASLEGYLYPDTYEVDTAHDPSVVIEKALDNFYETMQERELLGAFGAPGLTFHEAVIMASIVEREVNTAEDRPVVAQVFLKRLKIDMRLGSDATFVYAAQQMGVPPAVELDSPYNTRLYKGLPPGPIASFTADALAAVANPANTDYLYFVTGDDNVTHYARTEQGHQENVEKYCGERCEL